MKRVVPGMTLSASGVSGREAFGQTWHGYVECPVCGSTDITDGTVEDPLILVAWCNGCGQTLTDTYIGETGSP